MSAKYSLQNQLLISSPNLVDMHFHKSVVYIYEHNADGAFGIVITKPLALTLADLSEHVDLKVDGKIMHDHAVYMGGPVSQNRGFVLHFQDAKQKTKNNLIVSTSKELLQNLVENKKTNDTLIALGCSSWSPGQLENEIKRNDWLSATPADRKIIFDIPAEQRWRAAVSSLGINVDLMSHQVGHC